MRPAGARPDRPVDPARALGRRRRRAVGLERPADPRARPARARATPCCSTTSPRHVPRRRGAPRRFAAGRRPASACRMFGGDCYAYGLLAMGFADLVVETSLEPYDFMALVPVIEGAGGRITDWAGQALGFAPAARRWPAATRGCMRRHAASSACRRQREPRQERWSQEKIVRREVRVPGPDQDDLVLAMAVVEPEQNGGIVVDARLAIADLADARIAAATSPREALIAGLVSVGIDAAQVDSVLLVEIPDPVRAIADAGMLAAEPVDLDPVAVALHDVGTRSAGHHGDLLCHGTGDDRARRRRHRRGVSPALSDRRTARRRRRHRSPWRGRSAP